MVKLSDKEEHAIRSLHELNLKGDKDLREFSSILINLIQRLEAEVNEKENILNSIYDVRETDYVSKSMIKGYIAVLDEAIKKNKERPIKTHFNDTGDLMVSLTQNTLTLEEFKMWLEQLLEDKFRR